MNGSVEDAVQVSYGHAVVGHGNASIYGGFQPVEDLLAGNHAAAALDDHGVLPDVGDGVEAGHEVEVQLFARVLLNPAGQLAAPDVLAGGKVRARLQH